MSSKNGKARLILSSLVLSLSMASHPLHAESDLFQVLLDKARYLQARGKPDQSADAWHKVLASSPNHKEAMLWLGISEAHAGNLDKAKEYASALQAAGGSAAAQGALQRAIAMGSPDAESLKAARKLAESGQSGEAVEQYRKAFRNIDPTDYLALEYYQVLAATPDGWSAAKTGLEGLAREFPDQTLFKYALAKHLSYRETTRREAISMLERLQSDSAVGGDAAKDLRQALEWLQVRSGDEALLDRYARKWPGDSMIKAKRKELRWRAHGPDERDRALKQAYEEIEKGDLAKAEELLHPFTKGEQRDGEVVAAIGLIRLKQERFDESADTLERAIKSDPGNDSVRRWRETQQSAKYWSLIRHAERLKQESRLKEAEALLREAIALRPADPVPRNALAEVLAKLGLTAKAREEYEGVLKRDPDNIDARFGLVFVLIEQGERDRALQLANDLTREHPEKGIAFATLRAQAFSESALIATDEKIRSQAVMKLQEMLAQEPNNLWIRLDLARVYRVQGRSEEARSLIDGLLMSNPGEPATLYARALLHEEEGELLQALNVLEKIPPAARNAEMRRLQRQLWVNLQTQQAKRLASQGQSSAARDLLEQVSQVVSGEPEFIGLLANGWRDIGDSGRALALLRKSKREETDLKMVYLGLLLETGQNAEAEMVMSELEKRKLTPAQHRALDEIYVGYSVKRANDLRERGEYAKAYEYLAPLRSNYPDNEAAAVALATLHATVGDDNEAFAYYIDVLKKNPRDNSALVGAAGVALKSGDYDLARDLADHGLRIAPGSAEAHALAGKVAHATGDDAAAVGYFEKALTLDSGITELVPIRRILDTEKPQPRLQRIERQSRGLQLSLSGRATDENDGNGATYSTPIMQEAAEELAGIKAAYSDTAKAGVLLRNRDGDGLNKLNEIEIPLEYSHGINYSSRLTFSLVPVMLDGGSVGADKGKYFGTYMLNQAAVPSSLSLSDSGVAPAVAFDNRNWHLDAGVTPLGFTEGNVVGGVERRFSGNGIKTSLGLNRRAVTQSVISYAGVTDSLSGKSWGGVTESSLDVGSSYDMGKSGVYGTISYAGLSGTNVPNNNKLQFGAGFYNHLVQTAQEKVTAGLHVNVFGFDRNLGQFSYGHGGYFSPRRYVSLSTPVNWSGHKSDLRYGLGGSVGIQSFAEDPADYFPGDSTLQSQLETLATTDPTVTTAYKGSSKSGFTYDMHGEFEYGLDRQLAVGTRMGLTSSQNFTEFTVMVYAVYWAEPQKGRVAPAPPRPFYRGYVHD